MNILFAIIFVLLYSNENKIISILDSERNYACSGSWMMFILYCAFGSSFWLSNWIYLVHCGINNSLYFS